MTTQERAEQAVLYKHSGCNCAQAVAAAYTDLVTVDRETLMKLTSGYGGGMGSMEATCGSLIGAVMIAGLLRDGNGSVPTAGRILRSFQARCGATICRELKGRDTGKVLCPCDDCVRNAVMALEETMHPESALP